MIPHTERVSSLVLVSFSSFSIPLLNDEALSLLMVFEEATVVNIGGELPPEVVENYKVEPIQPTDINKKISSAVQSSNQGTRDGPRSRHHRPEVAELTKGGNRQPDLKSRIT